MPVRPCPYNLRIRPADFAEVHKAQICLESLRKSPLRGVFSIRPCSPLPYYPARMAVPVRLARTSLPVRPCTYEQCRIAFAAPARTALPVRPCVWRCPHGRARTARPSYPVSGCLYDPARATLAVRPWPYNPGCTTLAVRLWPYSRARTALDVGLWPYGLGCTALPVQPCTTYGTGHNWAGLPVQPWLCGPAGTTLPVRPCPCGHVRTALPVRPRQYDPGRKA